MNLHLLEFFRRQFSRLRNDVLGHRKLSDVVQHRCRLQCLSLVRAQSQFLGQFHGVHAHPLQVLASRFVLGFDGQRQCFDRPQMQNSTPARRAAFPTPACPDRGGRSGTSGRLAAAPAETTAIRSARSKNAPARHGGADHVVRERATDGCRSRLFGWAFFGQADDR